MDEKIILFMVIDQFADWEAAYLSSAIHMLGQGVFKVKTVGITKEPVTSIGGFQVIPDFDINTIPTEYEALILVGAMTWRNELAKKVEAVVKQCQQQDRILAGICDAAGFLGTVGALNQAEHTGNDLGDLKNWAGSHYTGEKKYKLQQAVRDGKLITANGTAALEFAREVLYALHVASEEKIEGWYQFHKLGFYDAPMPEM